MPSDEMPGRIDQALSDVGMTAFADRAPHLLSGGQKQRVAIAGILAMQPEALILDEATAMLDPSGRKDVLDTVKRLNSELGITVVWITHFMEEATQADRVVVMHEGHHCYGRHAASSVRPDKDHPGLSAGCAAL